MINSLQTLRAVASSAVFMVHFGFSNRLLLAWGDCRISWFIIISGFVLCASHEKKFIHSEGKILPSVSYKDFFISRIFRIYPLYFATFILFGFLVKFGGDPRLYLSHIFMLQSWIPERSFYFGLNSPTWFLSSLMVWYALFLPTLSLLLNRRKVLNRIVFSGLIAYFAIVFLVPEDYVFYAVYINPLMQFPIFLFGMYLWQYISPHLGRSRSPLAADVAILLLIAAIYIINRLSLSVTPRLTLASYWWIPSMLTISILSLFDKSKGVIMRILTWKPFVTFGNFSFSFYILHLPYIYIFRIILDKIGFHPGFYIEFIIAFSLLLVISYFVNLRVERPLVRLLDGKLKILRMNSSSSE